MRWAILDDVLVSLQTMSISRFHFTASFPLGSLLDMRYTIEHVDLVPIAAE